jgi:pilus assembly protein HofO
MRGEIEHWLTGRKRVLMISVVLVLIAGAWVWLLLLSQPEIQERRMPRIQAQWRKLLPLRVALQTVVMDEKQTQAFSPLNLPATGAALMAWRPMGGGGEMQLEVGWQAVPALFSWLASCGMRVTAFSMQPENQVLRLTLQLEAEDAP